MTLYLNCGFGELLSHDDLGLIDSLGYDGIRQNVPNPGVAAGLVANVLDYGFKGIFIVPVDDPTNCQETAHAVAEATNGRPNAMVEVGNEEDLGGKRWSRDPRGWAALVKDVVNIVFDHTAGTSLVVSGGISSLSKDAIKWLINSEVSKLPVDAIGYHQYRSTPVHVPLDGYGSRSEEFAALDIAAGLRAVICTETGWSTAPRESGHWPNKKRWQYTDDQVLDFLQLERELNLGAGAQGLVQYQLNDAEPETDQNRFGIRRSDGTLKPQSRLPKL